MSSYSIREESDALVVQIDDPASLNDFRSNAFRDGLYESVVSRHAKSVALDMGKVDFLSSSGVAILVGLKRRVESNQGRLVLFAVQPVVYDLLRITRLVQFFTFADDEAQALNKTRSLPAV